MSLISLVSLMSLMSLVSLVSSCSVACAWAEACSHAVSRLHTKHRGVASHGARIGVAFDALLACLLLEA